MKKGRLASPFSIFHFQFFIPSLFSAEIELVRALAPGIAGPGPRPLRLPWSLGCIGPVALPPVGPLALVVVLDPVRPVLLGLLRHRRPPLRGVYRLLLHMQKASLAWEALRRFSLLSSRYRSPPKQQ